MQCIICENDDQLSNLVAVKSPSPSLNGYAHQRCIDQHNKTAAKNLRALDASMTATEIFGYDIDATDPGAVERFFSERNQKVSERHVNEVVAAAAKIREHDNRQWLFEQLERNAEEWPGVISEAFIRETAEGLKEFALRDEDACHFAARMLTLQVAWRKHKEALDASYDEYLRSAVDA